MLDFLYKYRKDYKYSQNGEEGCLEQIIFRFEEAGVTLNRNAVEIGGNDGRWCSNIALLCEFGWDGLFVETDYDLYQRCRANWAGRDNVRAQCSHVDGNNINAFVKDDCDLLSLDTDGGDYEIFKGLIARPKIVIMEIDSSILPNQEGFNSDGGVGYWTGVELGLMKGYFLLCHTGNLIFVDEKYRELFPEIVGDPLIDIDKYFNPAWLTVHA